MAAEQNQDHWSSEAYQSSASFVPKLATEVVQWLDVQPDDVILDVGCGDGILNLQFAQTLSKGKGRVHGVDSSSAMITAAQNLASEAKVSEICTFEVLDASALSTVAPESHNKIFSNAAMHWILRPTSIRAPFFKSIHSILKPGGQFVFEMGGMGNVAEMRTALLAVVGRRIPGGIENARELDPWFFPNEEWMTGMLEKGGFRVEKMERVMRSTRADEGGIEGWVRLMGKQFFDGLEEGIEREKAIKEVVEVLRTVCVDPCGGRDWIGYVRLRGVATKI